MKGISALPWVLASTGLTLLALLSANWLGPVGLLGNLLAAVPLCWMGLRYGVFAALAALVITWIALWPLGGIPAQLSYVAIFSMPSLLLPWLLRRGMRWDLAVLRSSGAALLLAVVLLLTYLSLTGQELFPLLDGYLQGEVERAIQLYRAAELDAEQLQMMTAFAHKAADFIRISSVGLYFLSVLVVHAVTLTCNCRLPGTGNLPGPPFADWHLPPRLIWLLIGSGFVLLLPLAPARLLGLNLLVVLLPAYFLQGLSIVSCFLQRRSWSPLLKSVIYLLLFFVNPLPLVVTGVGLFDLWVDFRRPPKKEQQ